MAKKRQKSKENVKILGIETSCDETSVALLEYSSHVARRSRPRDAAPETLSRMRCGRAGRWDDGTMGRVKLVKHYIATQIPIHARYGGVVPEIAARTHVAEIISLLEKTLGSKDVARRTSQSSQGCRARNAFAYAMRAGGTMGPARNAKRQLWRARRWDAGRFDAIAVTRGPGLATALRVGLEAAKTLAWTYEKPLIPVNHLEGHLASAWLVPQNRKNWKFPILFLLVSGGHTELVLMKDFGSYKVLGRTRDDASGEAFDKTAKLLGLEYPGGPKLSQLASQGNPKAFALPRPMIHDPSLDFSFSGLKTAVRQLVERRTSHVPIVPGTVGRWDGGTIEDMCASIQAAIVETLVAKTVRAAVKVRPRAVAVVGGVSANPLLKSELRKALRRECPGIKLLAPAKGLFTDNGAMIAAAGLWHFMKNKKTSSWRKLDADPGLDF